MAEAITGGCQCGAVRYALHVDKLQKPHVCHCRMCQRATGGLFAALAGAPRDKVEFTAGQPAWFASSNLATRGFCRDCGTPLSFAYNDPKARFYVTIGSLDNPEQAVIETQCGIEGKLLWVDFCEDVPGEATINDADTARFYESMKTNQA
jgi:hypothetical protein